MAPALTEKSVHFEHTTHNSVAHNTTDHVRRNTPATTKTLNIKWKVKVRWSRYSPGVAQRVGRGIALLFRDRGTRRGWVVSSTSWPHFTPGKDPVPIWHEAGLAPGPVWTGRKSRPYWDSILDCPVRSSVAILTELPGPQILNTAAFSEWIQGTYWRIVVMSWY